ncbi:MAG: DUF1887 family CARF protein [Thiohalocapsa sp.]|jgi:hypothetical protein|uniref:Card1-like endonuclease domain-containing protein n=1 Tax=Thiohalocapsa sp. TaxID=2497641 RepID=UPI0025DFD30D|nr:DUF1887 family CARF protein [Thiohalocapsa sp.]MCG6940639.1 DUF1887 family CARF protein [Thiohalocapsa sp.]
MTEHPTPARDAAATPIHLLLISAQATPNLTPALDPDVRPARVVLLVSPDMARRAAWLESVLAPRGVRVTHWPIDDAWDLEHIQFRVLELLEAERAAADAGALALNATGGTKPMAIAAFDVFRAYGLPVYYVHPEQDRLIWLQPAERANHALANRVGLDDFLAAHGSRVEGRVDDAVPAPRRALTDWLVAENERIGRPLGTLNYLANAAERTLRSPPIDADRMRDADFGALVRRFADAGLLGIDHDRLVFPDEEARFYANGGWLEGHVHACLRELRAALRATEDEAAGAAPRQIQDLARSLRIQRETARGDLVPNEIDVACLAENRLYLVECKTRNWRGANAPDPGADALYRLDALGDLLGGLQAKALLVSYRELPAHVLRRAADLRIRVCAGRRLPELPAALRAWIGAG